MQSGDIEDHLSGVLLTLCFSRGLALCFRFCNSALRCLFFLSFFLCNLPLLFFSALAPASGAPRKP